MATSKQKSEMNFEPGAVLIDNTTIYGASNAYKAWPPTASDWVTGSNAVNLRSLMDLLEALVLYNVVVVDISSAYASASPVSRAESYFHEVGWEQLFNLRDEPHPILRTTKPQEPQRIIVPAYFAGFENGALVEPLVITALEKLRTHLRDGTFAECIRDFQQRDLALVVPEFYRSPLQFSQLLTKGFESLSEEAASHLRDVTRELGGHSHQVSNYAMFAFRGFYYQDLAHLFSISYTPHTWRSTIVDTDTEKALVNFAQFVFNVASNVRQELAARLNTEFRTTAFTSEFPVLAAYIAHNCTHRGDLLRTALEIRRSSSAKAFRKWVSVIQASIQDQDDLPKIANATGELKTMIADLRKELGLVDDKSAEEVKIKLGVPIASLEVPVQVKTGMPGWIQRILHRRTHLVFLRMVTRQSVALSPFALRFHQLKP